MNSKKILIIRNDHIGDLVLSTAVFRELKKSFPNSKITIIVNKLNRPLIEKNYHIDKIIELNMADYTLKSIREYFEMSRKIRKMKFDVGIDLRGGIMNGFFLLWLSGIKKRISRIDAHPMIRFFLTDPIKIHLESHVTEDNINIINKGLELYSNNKRLEIITDEEDEKFVKEFIKKNKLKNYVCFYPCARLIEKQWPLKKWKEIIKDFDKKYQILLMGIEDEKNILGKLSKLNKNCMVFTNFNVRQLSLLFKKSKLVLTQDGGPMHIAWVSGAKLIGLHNLFLFGMNKVVPLGKNSNVVYTKDINMNSVSIKKVKEEIKSI